VRRLSGLLVVLAILPDLDVLGFYAGIPYGHPLGHRGVTHSLAFALVLGFGSAAMSFRDVSMCGARGLRVALLCSLACASHGILDAITDAGLGVGFFLPFDDARYFFGWRPLRTSPLSIGAFMSRNGLAILANEAWYVGIPTAVAAALSLSLRQALSRTSSSAS